MRKRAPSGFTLVEMLVALALLAMLSLLLVGGLRMSRNAVLSGEAASQRLLRTERAFNLIRRQIEDADPLPLADTANRSPVAFAGDAANIRFIAPPAAYMALGGEEIAWLAIEPGKGGSRVVLRFRPLDRAEDRWPPALDGAAMTSVVLIDGLARAEFSYFGRDANGGDPQWWADWRDRTTLPGLVRLAIAGGGTDWPDLVVAPRLGRPAATGLLPAEPICTRNGTFPC